ncbi:MAG: MoaD/ThiS family protein [Planctomycetota bacterium]
MTRTFEVAVFGPQAEAAGVDRLTVAVPGDGPVTAGDVFDVIGRSYPALAGSLKVSRLARDHRFVEPGASVSEGDELALIGLVGGG